MNALFDFIFSNLFILVIIVAAILNFVNKGKGSQTDKRRTRPVQGERPTTSHPENKPIELPQTFGDVKDLFTEEKTEQLEKAEPDLNSVLDEREAQYERLRSEIQQSSSSFTKNDEAQERDIPLQPKEIQQQKKEKRIPLNVNKRLSHEGLIESVIMSEVLGPPRAYNRYRYGGYRK